MHTKTTHLAAGCRKHRPLNRNHLTKLQPQWAAIHDGMPLNSTKLRTFLRAHNVMEEVEGLQPHRRFLAPEHVNHKPARACTKAIHKAELSVHLKMWRILGEAKQQCTAPMQRRGGDTTARRRRQYTLVRLRRTRAPRLYCGTGSRSQSGGRKRSATRGHRQAQK